MDAPRGFGPFQLLAQAGQGGMARVFRAKVFGASGFEKTVAVKCLLEELVGEGEAERMFFAEARLQARLSHPNLLEAHDLGVADGVPWVRLEWIDGGSLDALTRGVAMPPALALLVAEGVALGLSALHAATDDAGRPLGLVHRDVSPSNVLLSVDGAVKLADFGITKATLQKDETRGAVRKGKYAYMSPEQVSGRPLSPASDQFALGATLAELLTGARPFEGATPLETMDRVRAAEPPPLPSLDPALDAPLAAFVRRLLVKLPQDRFQSDDALLDALEVLRRVTPASPRALGAWVRERTRPLVP